MSLLRKAPIALVLFIAFVFVQSLFFKFTDSPETQYIFGTLDAWAGGLERYRLAICRRHGRAGGEPRAPRQPHDPLP